MHIPDPEYFVAAADPGQYDRLQKPVRERCADGDRSACDRGDICEHGGSGCVLQVDGSEAVRETLPEIPHRGSICPAAAAPGTVCPADSDFAHREFYTKSATHSETQPDRSNSCGLRRPQTSPGQAAGMCGRL